MKRLNHRFVGDTWKSRDVCEMAMKAISDAFPDSLGPDRHYEIELAISEICTNVRDHAYEAEVGDMVMEIDFKESECRIRFIDWGRPFDPTQRPDPDLAKPKEGGYGIFLVRRTSDEFTYKREDDKNCVTLIFSVGKEANGRDPAIAEA